MLGQSSIAYWYKWVKETIKGDYWHSTKKQKPNKNHKHIQNQRLRRDRERSDLNWLGIFFIITVVILDRSSSRLSSGNGIIQRLGQASGDDIVFALEYGKPRLPLIFFNAGGPTFLLGTHFFTATPPLLSFLFLFIQLSGFSGSIPQSTADDDHGTTCALAS